MDFIDATLVRLADPETRAAVFDDIVLEQMAKAAYGAEALSITGPYSAVFDKVTFGVSVAPLSVAEGVIRNHDGAPTADIHIQVGGLGPLLPARVDALWRGSIVARTLPADSHISSARARFAIGDIDAGIVRDLGALPADPAALETARRTRVIAEMKAMMAQPDLLTDETFDQWLGQIGASSTGDLIANQRGTLAPGVVQVEFSAPDPAQQPAPRSLSVVAAILIRDVGFSLAQLLMESKMVRDQLAEQGVAAPAAGLPALNPFLIVWVIPLTVFDDEKWPGSGAGTAPLRSSRRENASAWLGPEGIAIAGVEVP